MEVIKANAVSKTFSRPLASTQTGVIAAIKQFVAPPKENINVIDNVSLSVQQGEFVGLLGANGSGKSTLLKLLTGILQPDAGSLTVLGHHPSKERKAYTKKIGAVFGQKSLLWWNVAIIESFRLYASIYKLSRQDSERRIEQLSELLGLRDLLSSPPKKLSLGQRMKAEVVASLLHQPQLIFLDEPTIAMDPVSRLNLMNFLLQLNRDEGTSIVLTSHNMADVHHYCQRSVIMEQGAVLFDGKTSDILSLEHVKVLEIKTCSALDSQLLSEFEYELIEDNHYRIKTSTELAKEALSRLAFHPSVKDVNLSPPSLDHAIHHFMTAARNTL
ncbi:ATP-binding cassette domain-containing protein [Pseudoalteromonas sp. J010]|uniref:ABC transporter ATP-binding protein n=1 Tax=Pseudoalteromonas sp. J010 TaxID=998465 RepID=UPI000F6481EC|nr:ATP-binding cassette domain-containing protein [Pseudoalteromonas sp. J010]RRS09897.1 ATP-binding cassette domain-containing protein [Pseudoalteromonas sp. J010]